MKNSKLIFLLAIVITSYLQVSCTKTGAVEPEGLRITSEAISSALQRSEELFKQRDDIANLRGAVDTLRKARDYKQRNFEVEWRFAKLNYFLGKQSTDEKEYSGSFEEGRDAAKIASNLEPQKPEGYFWYGANLGELSRKKMLTVGARSIGEVRSAMDKVIELRPAYQNSSAYDVLGQIELETRLLGGKAEKAIEIFETALQNEDNNMNLHLHLAEAYLAVNKDAEARKHLAKVLAMKPNPEYMLECREAVDKARKLLETKF
jgi:tetratricopeptide (TPR) repeat protein